MTTEEMNPFAETQWNDSPDAQATETNQNESVDSQDKNVSDEPEGSQGTTDASSSKDSESKGTDGSTPKGDDESNLESTAQEPSERTQPQLEFKNEISQKIFESITNGNYTEIAPIIYEQTVLSNLDKMSESDVLKLQIQYDNPDMSESDVEKEFSDRYSADVEEKDTEYMTDEEVAEHKKSIDRANKKLQKEIKRDFREAVKILGEKKVDIELPNIQEYMKTMSTPKDNSAEVQEYNEYISKERQKYEDTIEPSLEKIAPFELDYQDDEVNFKVNFLPNKEDISGLKDKLKAFTLEDYFGPKYYNQEKGEYNTTKLADDIYWMENRDKIVKSIVSQAVSSAKADMLKKIKGVNISDSPSSKSSNQSTKSEVDSWIENLYSM